MSSASTPPPRRPIPRRIVTDEEMRPVAVQIQYEDWLEIERILAEREEESTPFDTMLEKTSGIWTRGDGLAYQKRMREEWGGA